MARDGTARLHERVAAAGAFWELHGDDCEASLSGPPDGDEVSFGGFAEKHEPTIVCPGHARELKPHEGGHAGQLRQLPGLGIQEPEHEQAGGHERLRGLRADSTRAQDDLRPQPV
jgi:hypothetical protein